MMDVMIETSVRIIVLAAVVAAGLRVIRISPRVAHQAWTGVCAVMLVLPATVAWAPEAGVPVLPSSTAQVSTLRAPSRASTVVQSGAADVTPTETAARTGVSWRLIAGGVYGTGVVFLLTGLAFGCWRARTMIQQATRINGRLTHPRCVTPITVGLWSPVVILPPDWLDWDPSDLAAVLAHEEEHVRRRDPLVAFVALLNRAAFWFHPFAWWLQREIATLSEQACDAAVLSRGHDEVRYAAALVRFARTAAQAGGRIASVGTPMPGAGLRRRLHLLEAPLPQATHRRWWITAGYAIAVIVCAGATPTRAQAPAAIPTGSNGWRSSASDHFEIFASTDQEGRVAGVTQEAEAAYARLTTLLKYDLTTRVPLIVVGRSVSRNDGRVEERVPRSATPGRPSIVIFPDDPRPNAIVHELTHAFTFEILPNVTRTAPWLMEGLAEHMRGTWDPASLASVRRAVQARGIPTVTAMKDVHWGHALFDYIVERSNEDGLRRFLFALRARSDLGDAIQMAFGTPPSAFSEALASYVTGRFGAQ